MSTLKLHVSRSHMNTESCMSDLITHLKSSYFDEVFDHPLTNIPSWMMDLQSMLISKNKILTKTNNWTH